MRGNYLAGSASRGCLAHMLVEYVAIRWRGIMRKRVMVLVMGHWSMGKSMRVPWVVLHGVHGSICVERISRRRRRWADVL